MAVISVKNNKFANIDKQNSLVIDVTYKCNSSCYYCQWGESRKSSKEINYEKLLVPEKTLSSIGIERVVLSGGEPLLHNRIIDIIDYYNQKKVDSIILLTNGILLDLSKLQLLLKHGVTGVTFSIDSLDFEVMKKSRNVTKEVHQKIINNINSIVKFRETKSFELGINCVISSSNLRWDYLHPLVQFCNQNNIDWLKFQPIFDDGYLSLNAPQLKLSKNHSEDAIEIGKKILNFATINTNSIEFWKSLSSVLHGKKLLGKSCGLDKRQTILIRGDLKFCYWLDNPIYSSCSMELTKEKIQEIRDKFKDSKERCKTGMYCFCLQSLSHKWDISK